MGMGNESGAYESQGAGLWTTKEARELKSNHWVVQGMNVVGKEEGAQ